MLNPKKEQEKLENTLETRELENFYVNSTISNLPELVEQRTNELSNKINKYIINNKKTWMDSKGNYHEKIEYNPVVLNNYFFRSLNPIVPFEPKYTAETLGIAFQLYQEICSNVNEKIGTFIPNISNFCKFVGITTTTFHNYRNNSELNMRILVEMVEDYMFDMSVSSSQLGVAKENITKYRMKTELGKVEQETPTIHIHNEKIIDVKAVSSRLESLINFNNKKVMEAKIDEK